MTAGFHVRGLLTAGALAGVIMALSAAVVSQEQSGAGAGPGGGATGQAAIRYLDMTARNDGWALAQNAAIVGSREKRIVVVSYADPQTTRAFYDLAVIYAGPPYNLPVFGVARAPDHPTEKSLNGFDVFFNGLPLGEMENPDNHFTSVELMRGLFDSIKEHYFAND